MFCRIRRFHSFTATMATYRCGRPTYRMSVGYTGSQLKPYVGLCLHRSQEAITTSRHRLHNDGVTIRNTLAHYSQNEGQVVGFNWMHIYRLLLLSNGIVQFDWSSFMPCIHDAKAIWWFVCRSWCLWCLSMFTPNHLSHIELCCPADCRTASWTAWQMYYTCLRIESGEVGVLSMYRPYRSNYTIKSMKAIGNSVYDIVIDIMAL